MAVSDIFHKSDTQERDDDDDDDDEYEREEFAIPVLMRYECC